MKTSEQSTATNGEDEWTSSRGDFRASLFPPPDEDEERKTIASSGQRCYELYEKYSPHGSLLKTCAGFLLRTMAWYSSACNLSWRHLGTSANRFLFQLAPLERPTDEIESGLLLTPRASEHEEDQERFVERMGDRSADAYATLSNQIVGLLPTVRTSSANGESAKEVAAGNPKGRLETEIAMLPTPTTRDWKGARKPETLAAAGRGITNTLEDALVALLPTPRASEFNGRDGAQRTPGTGGKTLSQEVGKKRGYKLQPAFAAWMMGFPENWTELPFQSGEKTVSEPTETL